MLANESGAEEKEWDAGGRRTRRAGNGRASGQLLGGEHFAGGRAAGRARWVGAARGPRAIRAARIFGLFTLFSAVVSNVQGAMPARDAAWRSLFACMMSASLPNARELAAWLGYAVVHEAKLRPTPLTQRIVTLQGRVCDSAGARHPGSVVHPRQHAVHGSSVPAPRKPRSAISYVGDSAKSGR